MKNRLRQFLKSTLPLFLLVMIPFLSFGQKRPDLPKPQGPIDLSDPTNILLYIIIPAIILIAFFVFRKRIFKVKEEQKERLKEKNQEGNKEN